MTSRRSSDALSEADADVLLSGRAMTGHDELREIIGLMRTASAVPAPTPTAALAAVLNDGFDPLPVESTPSASRWGRWSMRITAVTTAAMLGTFGAATANALPAPIQTAVANVVGAVTPLELPRPSANARTGSDDQGGPSGQPPAVPSELTRNAGTAADQPSGESADSMPVLPETAPPRPEAPAVVTPPRPPEATATATEEPGEPYEPGEPDVDDPDADVQESDVANADDAEQPESSGNDADVPESDEADTDEPEQPDSGEVDQSDAHDRDLLDPGEPALERAQPNQDEPDAETSNE